MHTTTLSTETVCPFCARRYDAATDPSADGRTPKDGDVSMCLGCGEWAVFATAAPGGLRRPTHAEYEEIVANSDAARMRSAWQRMQENRERASRAEQKYRAIVAPNLSLDEQFQLACKFAYSTPPPPILHPVLKRMFMLGALVFGNRLLTAAKKEPAAAAAELDRLIEDISRISARWPKEPTP